MRRTVAIAEFGGLQGLVNAARDCAVRETIGGPVAFGKPIVRWAETATTNVIRPSAGAVAGAYIAEEDFGRSSTTSDRSMVRDEFAYGPVGA